MSNGDEERQELYDLLKSLDRDMRRLLVLMTALGYPLEFLETPVKILAYIEMAYQIETLAPTIEGVL